MPQWYLDGKFGFYTHWGVYSVPGFGNEWYPRRMYNKGNDANKHQIDTYGPLSTSNGYKEFIPKFTGEYFNASEWMDIFHRAGAKYAGPVGEHHDGFAMYNCSINKWNSVQMGPKRDVVGELKAAAEALPDMRFVVSSHRAWHSSFYDKGREIPESDVYQCSCDGGGKAASDPDYCSLYCPANSDEKTPTDGFMRDWLLRTCEIIDNYSNDVMYFDWWIGVSPVWQPYVQKLAAFYYNRMHQAGKMGVINTKDTTMPPGTDVLDFERGQACGIEKDFWQTDTSISERSWGFVQGDTYKSAESIIGNLVDIVSKNGALLMNVGPAPNGTMPAAAVDTFLRVGAWLDEAGEAIYGTRPYHIFGEGPTLMGCGKFSAEVANFSKSDFRFTSKGNDTVYALAMGAVGGQEIVVSSLGDSRAASGDISSVEVLGHGAVKWTVEADGLRVTLPTAAGSRGPPVLAVRGVSDSQWDGKVRQGQDGSVHFTATAGSLARGAKLDTIAECSGACTGSIATIGSLDGSAEASWTLRVRQGGAFTPSIVASSPSGVRAVTVSVLAKDGSAVQQANIEVAPTRVNEFAVSLSSVALTLPEGDVVLSISARANETVVAATDSDFELATLSLAIGQITIV